MPPYINCWRTCKRQHFFCCSYENAITKVSSNSNADKITYSSWKKENPVELEAGDKVTFTIKLTNSGTTPVEVAQIYDQFTYTKTIDKTQDEEIGDIEQLTPSPDHPYDGPEEIEKEEL